MGIYKKEKMIICVSGSTGFVGQNLLSYLENADIGVKAYPIKRAGKAPVLPADFENCDAVIHLAGKAHDLKDVSHPEEYYDANYRYTRDLFDAFCASKARKFIFISSVKSVADHFDGTLTEDVKPNPNTHYGRSKLQAEEYIEKKTVPSWKSCYILRPCMIHGPGNKGNLNLLYKFVSKGVPYPLAAYANKRSFLSVENLCFVIREILERSDIPKGTYNVADDEALSTNEVVTLISQSLDLQARLWPVPAGFVQMLAKAGDLLRLPLNSERLGKLTENYVVSNGKIVAALGKSFPLTAREGILHTLRSFRNG